MMRTSVLRDFFIRRASALDLATDLVGSRVRQGRDTIHHKMADDMSKEFSVGPEHLILLCDAVIAGDLDASQLEVIGFGMIASDYFVWDADTPSGSRVAETVYDWSAPEVNYALRPETVSKFRHRLLTGEEKFDDSDFESHPKTMHRVVWSNQD